MDETFKRAALSLTPAGGSLTRSDLTDPATAADRAALLFGCYRRDEAADPVVYSAAVTATLAEFAPWVVAKVTDPRTGLPARLKFLPTVAEVREACETELAREQRAEDNRRQIEQQLAERAEWEAKSAKPRPSLEDLKSKYGPDWGLKGTPEEREEQRKKDGEFMDGINQKLYARMGMKPGDLCTPALRDQLKKTRDVA